MKVRHQLTSFWSFYKWQIAAALILGVLFLSCLGSIFTKKECALSVILMDCHTETNQEEMEREVLEALCLDRGRYTVDIQTSLLFEDTGAGGYAMVSISRFLSDIGNQKLDVCGMLESSFLKYDTASAFLDLRNCFSEAELNLLGDALYIAEDGRVIGLYADRLPGLQSAGCYTEANVPGIIGIIYNTNHLDMAREYLLHLARTPT